MFFMKNKFYNNADSFAMSFDDAWQKINCEDLMLKMDKVIEELSEHPYVVSNPVNAKNIAKFRVFTLKKFQ